MRQRKLNLHYNLLMEEVRLREEAMWLKALINELDNRLLVVECDVQEYQQGRLLLERELCPVQELPAKREPRKHTKKQGSMADIVAQLEHLTAAEKKIIEDMIGESK